MKSGLRRAARSILAVMLAVMPVVGAQAIEIKEVTTPLGIKAWLVEDKSAPVVALSFSFAGGTASDPDGQLGVTSLMATLLTDGAGTLDAQAFRRRQEDAAASLGFGATKASNCCDWRFPSRASIPTWSISGVPRPLRASTRRSSDRSLSPAAR